MKYKLIVLDVDGTMLNSNRELTKRTAQTLRKVQQMGIRVALASGRPTYGILPLAQAMNAYADEASEGDVVKSQDAFAVATKTTNGIIWKGDLKYMEAGKGYMLKRLAADSVSFYYPSYYSDSRYQNLPIPMS